MSGDDTYAPQSPDLSGYHSAPGPTAPYGQQPAYQHQAFQNTYQPPPSNAPLSPFQHHYRPPPSATLDPTSMPRRARAEPKDEDDEWTAGPSTPTGARKAKKQKLEEEVGKPAPGALEGIEVKTKFPVARIKRIMQADEDVGKVAQVTPTAVSKALELFMISLVTKAADQARSKSAKKVTAAHLKQAIEKDVQFDFLEVIISKVPDAPVPKKDEDSEGTGEGKKRKGSGRRRKKEDHE